MKNGYTFTLKSETAAAYPSYAVEIHGHALKNFFRALLVPRVAASAALLCLASFVLSRPATAQAAEDFHLASTPGTSHVLVHSKFGGQIFGFDIDQNGTEGVLSESQDLNNGNVLAAVETFDQKNRQDP